MANASQAKPLRAVDAAENQSDKVVYVAAKIKSTVDVMRLVLTAGLFSLRRDGIKAKVNTNEPVANTKSCQ